MDGGLQTIVQYLAADSLRNKDLTVHVDPFILSNADILGALQTTLPGHTFVDMNNVPPRDGNIIIKPVTEADNIVKIIAPQPTKTTTFYQVNSQKLLRGGMYDMDMEGMYGGANVKPACGSDRCSMGGGGRKKSKGRKSTRKSKSTKARKRSRSRGRALKSKRGGQIESE